MTMTTTTTTVPDWKIRAIARTVASLVGGSTADIKEAAKWAVGDRLAPVGALRELFRAFGPGASAALEAALDSEYVHTAYSSVAQSALAGIGEGKQSRLRREAKRAAGRRYRGKRDRAARASQEATLAAAKRGEWLRFIPGQCGGILGTPSQGGRFCENSGSARGIARALGVRPPLGYAGEPIPGWGRDVVVDGQGDWEVSTPPVDGWEYWVRLAKEEKGRWAPRRSRRDPVAFDMAAE